ncbi:hypothetical protein [Brachybacterium hainanense]|uniref:Pilus assembly protein TadE n=1 Tax=Brachybacterium hainanense TaxID=1541174 RepID=A0ABV6RE05_9MICO
MRSSRGEEGSAIVEFVVLALALLLPSLYLVLTLGSVQGAVFAADAIARDAARIHASDADPRAAARLSDQRAHLVLEDFGIPARGVLEISCTADPCASPGGTVTAHVDVPVQVPGLGPLLGEGGIVTVRGEHAVPVDRYRAGG